MYKQKTQEECDEIYNKVVEESRGNLTAEEYKELIALEYVLTFSYTDDIDKDEDRYKYLTNKKRNG